MTPLLGEFDRRARPRHRYARAAISEVRAGKPLSFWRQIRWSGSGISVDTPMQLACQSQRSHGLAHPRGDLPKAACGVTSARD